jgi:hypothetical protein
MMTRDVKCQQNLEEKGYAWDGQAWQPRTAREGRG